MFALSLELNNQKNHTQHALSKSNHQIIQFPYCLNLIPDLVLFDNARLMPVRDNRDRMKVCIVRHFV